ncbi:glycosyltransferase family 2 protein [Kineosporia sp. J2-2]|uniref:Glycosyltransferase family 2 protein n=1 Tax=Kineosporia corallincola TaxID=2835133 RepID=A0ABS5TK17_9ACTN|nr:glycosyltransferase family A protein [Kineosporia corallincola]MBT0770546.1 glycosyltransferase family 2 protein [Kineosporia corallincola]
MGVSVVVPTRDRPELLARAVRAVLAQQYAGAIECIVVFDQSDTHIPDVPTGPLRTLRVLRNTRTPGLAGSRNTGYLAASHPVVAACDDDDEWLPGKLVAQTALLAGHPEASIVATGIVVRFAGRDIPRVSADEVLTFHDFLRDRRMEVHPSTYLARRDAVVNGFGLVEEEIPGGYAEDYDWLLRAARTGPVVCVRQSLVRVNWHDGSFFTSRWEMIDQALTWLIARFPEFAGERRGLGRLQGQLAFANAALGRRRRALGLARAALLRHPTNRQAWAALLVLSRCVTPDQVIGFGRRIGRGV